MGNTVLSSKNSQDLPEDKLPSPASNARPRCAWCQQSLRRLRIKHTNPAYEGAPPFFCSVNCHNQWCYAQAAKK